MVNLYRKRRSTEKVTLADIAKHVGVGTMTVSRALRTPQLVSRPVREKIENAVKELGYIPNSAARDLASVSSRNIVVITSSIYSTENSLILTALQKEITKLGDIQLLILIAGKEDWLKALINHSPLAVILLNLEYQNIDTVWFKNSGVPCVDIGTQKQQPLGINVGIDSWNAMRIMLHFLLKKGYRKIGLLAANQQLSIFQQYSEHWHKILLREYLNPHLILHSTEDISFSAGAKLFNDAMTAWGKTDALVFLSDELACGALYEAQRQHISVPQECAIVGLGGLDISAVCYPALTTVEIPYAQLGKTAGEKLVELLQQKQGKNEPHFIPIPIRLLERQSA